MKIFSHLSVLSLLVLSVACGGGSSKSAGKKYVKITAEQIDRVMDNQYMSCGAIGGGSCPKGVVRLLTLNMEDAERSSVCSGFMVGPTTMVTNHHCIESQAECNNTHLAIYNGGQTNYLRSKCKTVTKTEQDYANANDPRRRIDYTVVEIEDSFSGTTFDLATARAAVSDTVTAWVVDHTGLDREEGSVNFFESRITQFNCQVESTSDYTSMMLRNCPVIHGNSGSPAVNSSGKIIGVIWGATDADVSSQESLTIRRAGPGKAAVTEMDAFADSV